MDEATRKSLMLTLKMTLGLLPRWMRHDLWRTCEPQHGHVVDRIAETIIEKVDEGFAVEKRTPKPVINFTYLYSGPNIDGGEKS
jgi:hypothetical protein